MAITDQNEDSFFRIYNRKKHNLENKIVWRKAEWYWKRQKGRITWMPFAFSPAKMLL